MSISAGIAASAPNTPKRFEAPGVITPVLTASRTRVTAPASIFFEAIGSTSTRVGDPFRQCTYTFGYGETSGPGIGTWAFSGLSKNQDVGGPLGAHVYETPGTYPMTLDVFDGVETKRVTVSIQVDDPAVNNSGTGGTNYTGANTICVNATGTSDGLGPAGCVYQNTFPTPGGGWTGKRVLLRRGQDFSAISGFRFDNGDKNFHVGAYGSGAKPIVYLGLGAPAETGGFGANQPTNTDFVTNATLSDLTFWKEDPNIGGACTHITILRCDSLYPTPADAPFGLGDILYGGYYLGNPLIHNYAWQSELVRAGTFLHPVLGTPLVEKVPFDLSDMPGYCRFNVLQETTTKGHAVGDGRHGTSFYGQWYKSAALGCENQDANEHTCRITQGTKVFLAHNAFRGGSNTYFSGTKNSLTFRANGTMLQTDTVEAGPASQSQISTDYFGSCYNVVANNIIGSATDNNGSTFTFAQSNGGSRPAGFWVLFADNIIENNRLASVDTTPALQFKGNRITLINNTLLSGAGQTSLNLTPNFQPNDPDSPIGSDLGPYYYSRA